jgi:hypothetical protein
VPSSSIPAPKREWCDFRRHLRLPEPWLSLFSLGEMKAEPAAKQLVTGFTECKIEFSEKCSELFDLSEPVEGALNLAAPESVTAKEFFETHLFKPGALQRVIDSLLRAR